MSGRVPRQVRPVLLLVVYGVFLVVVGVTATVQTALVSLHFSTAAGGAASRIVPFLQEGAGVITTRGHVRTVVTEWGVAELFGKTLGERAQALIGIAHPDFREGLERQAHECRLFPRGVTF